MRIPTLFLIPTLVFSQAPALTFEKVHHDFGKISPDRKVTHRFKATNAGNAMLNITHLNPSCGCTATVPGKWSLNPGESTEIEATFNPAGMKNLVRKSIQVTSNDPKTPVQTLTFEAEVVQEINLESSALFFLEVPRGTTRKATVRLRSGNAQPVVVTEIKAPGAPYLSGTAKADGKDAVVEMTFDPKKVPLGSARGVDKITLRTGSATQPTLTVDIQWEIKASITSTPDRVVFKDGAGKDHRMTLTLKHVDGRAFTLTGAKPTSSLLRVEGLGKKAAQQDVVVVLAGSAKAGSYNERVEFTTDDPDQPVVELRVAAFLN